MKKFVVLAFIASLLSACGGRDVTSSSNRQDCRRLVNDMTARFEEMVELDSRGRLFPLWRGGADLSDSAKEYAQELRNEFSDLNRTYRLNGCDRAF